jgi:hypothetical protein
MTCSVVWPLTLSNASGGRRGRLHVPHTQDRRRAGRGAACAQALPAGGHAARASRCPRQRLTSPPLACTTPDSARKQTLCSCSTLLYDVHMYDLDSSHRRGRTPRACSFQSTRCQATVAARRRFGTEDVIGVLIPRARGRAWVATGERRRIDRSSSALLARSSVDERTLVGQRLACQCGHHIRLHALLQRVCCKAAQPSPQSAPHHACRRPPHHSKPAQTPSVLVLHHRGDGQGSTLTRRLVASQHLPIATHQELGVVCSTGHGVRAC